MEYNIIMIFVVENIEKKHRKNKVLATTENRKVLMNSNFNQKNESCSQLHDISTKHHVFTKFKERFYRNL